MPSIDGWSDLWVGSRDGLLEIEWFSSVGECVVRTFGEGTSVGTNGVSDGIDDG